LRRAAVEGDTEGGSFMAGQIAALVKCVKPAREIIAEMFAEAEALLSGGATWVR
ncbi:MAG: enoyl-[acyl-carrier-protein] reductase FabK, partial [Clostridiales bacterium]|nr:enoyl-[acyl-carrier-protein] reductase FabK [Clostridiales bacterium]